MSHLACLGHRLRNKSIAFAGVQLVPTACRRQGLWKAATVRERGSCEKRSRKERIGQVFVLFELALAWSRQAEMLGGHYCAITRSIFILRGLTLSLMPLFSYNAHALAQSWCKLNIETVGKQQVAPLELALAVSLFRLSFAASPSPGQARHLRPLELVGTFVELTKLTNKEILATRCRLNDISAAQKKQVGSKELMCRRQCTADVNCNDLR